MGAPNDPLARLNLLAAREVTSIRKWLPRDGVPVDPAVSLLLHQPLLTAGMKGVGQLVDIGYRPAGCTTDRVCQSASSGETGNFLFGDHAARYQPTSSQIDERARDAYRAATPAELRAAQVLVERRRYPDIPWLDNDCPPAGALIHHISLAPPACNAAVPHPPILGIAYIMTNKQPEGDALWRLVHVAHQAALRALHRRVVILLEDDRKVTLQNLVSQAPHSIKEDQLHRLTLSWVFAHHWFFPHRPWAWEALRLIAGTEHDAEEKYRLFGWAPPLYRPAGLDLGAKELVHLIALDLLHVARQLTYDRFDGDSQLPRVESSLASCLTLLSNRLAVFRAENARLCLSNDPPRLQDFVSLHPLSDVEWGELDLPIFQQAQIFNNRRDEARGADALAPGVTGRAPNGGIKPSDFISHHGNGRIRTSKYDDAARRAKDWVWFRQFAFAQIQRAAWADRARR